MGGRNGVPLFFVYRQPLSQSALRRIASSPFGEPYGATTYQKLSPFMGKVARGAERGAAKNSRMPRVIPPQLRLRSAERWLEYGRLAALPLAILPIPPDSPLAASPTGRARLESPVSRRRLLVQYKHGVQCRTPSRSDRFNGVTGVARGPKGRNRNLPWPLGKKVMR